ncbi:LOW QUALITY PROTEIN: TRAP-type C4-dicarboxylate transport system, periplasmic component [Vibrio sp. JCM 19053]|nr:LOW QUALITY PROTEIN: TRAP-type C4-dicarboxylate transport system, periplasmic component [Vibrio sp. JCM 19053]
MFKPLTLLSVSALAVTSFNAAANCDPGETVIKFSHVTNADKHPKGIAASLLEKRVNEEMNGKVCMQVFPNSTLYDDDKVLEALLNGDVQLAAPSLSKFEKFTKKYRLFDLPFLFDDVDAVDRFQNSEAGEKLKNSMKRRGLQGIAFWHNGMKQMSANKPLISPTDAEGLKFRVQASDVLVAQFEQLGANPQKNVVQRSLRRLANGYWSRKYLVKHLRQKKFFEVQDGITETNHGILDYLVVTSNDFWKNLPDDQREQLNTIIQEVTAQRNAESTKVNLANKNNIIEAGGVVRTLTPEQRQEWVTALQPVWKKFEKDIGSDLIEAALASNQK